MLKPHSRSAVRQAGRSKRSLAHGR